MNLGQAEVWKLHCNFFCGVAEAFRIKNDILHTHSGVSYERTLSPPAVFADIDVLDEDCDPTPVETDNTCTSCDECPCECEDGNCSQFEKCSDSSEYELDCADLPNGMKVGDIIIADGECYEITARDVNCNFDPALPEIPDAGTFESCAECEASLQDCECCSVGLQGIEITIAGMEEGHFSSDPGDDCGSEAFPYGCGCTGINGSWLVPTTVTPILGHDSCDGDEDFGGNTNCTGWTNDDCDDEVVFTNSNMNLRWSIQKGEFDSSVCEVRVDLLVTCTEKVGTSAAESCIDVTVQARADISDYSPEGNWIDCSTIDDDDLSPPLTGFHFNKKCTADKVTLAWSAY